MKSITTVALLVACLPAVAQQAPTATPAPLPDIEFAADVHMDSIRFGGDPRAEVTFTGGPRLEHRHDVERDGLPRPVAAGTTYRNVTVRTTISATLLDYLDAPTPDTATTSPANEDAP